MAGTVFERCDPQGIIDIFGRKMPYEWKRMRSRIIKVLDNYYFKEL